MYITHNNKQPVAQYTNYSGNLSFEFLKINKTYVPLVRRAYELPWSKYHNIKGTFRKHDHMCLAVF